MCTGPKCRAKLALMSGSIQPSAPAPRAHATSEDMCFCGTLEPRILHNLSHFLHK